MTQYTIHLGTEGKLNGFNLNEEQQSLLPKWYAFEHTSLYTTYGRTHSIYTHNMNYDTFMEEKDVEYQYDWYNKTILSKTMYIKEEDYNNLNDLNNSIYYLDNNKLYNLVMDDLDAVHKKEDGTIEISTELLRDDEDEDDGDVPV